MVHYGLASKWKLWKVSGGILHPPSWNDRSSLRWGLLHRVSLCWWTLVNRHCVLYGSTTHNRRELGATWVSADGRMDTQNVVCTGSGMWPALIREEVLHLGQQDRPWGHYARRSKIVTERQMLYASTYRWPLLLSRFSHVRLCVTP